MISNFRPHVSLLRRVGLDVLVYKLLHKHLKKTSDRVSDWEGTLTDSQREYAALDALASLDLGLLVLSTPDPHLDADAVTIGSAVNIVVKNRNIASGVIVGDDSWGGHKILSQKGERVRAVVEIQSVNITAAFVPILPRPNSLPLHWPANPSDHRLTLGEIAAAFPQPGTPFKLIVTISDLHKA